MTVKYKDIEFRGMNFECLYGTRSNGGYVAILNFGVCANLSGFEGDYRYNSEKLLSAFSHSPSVGWLPSDEQARAEFVNGLSRIITDKIWAV